MYNLLVDFHGSVKPGQYMFPFSLSLPTMMVGSFFYSSNCYIKYMLRVELTHAQEEKQSQRYEMFLNILEPPRVPFGALSLTNTVNSQCCGCCTDYGNISVTLNSSKNFVLNGDTIQINGEVNNTQGKIKIDNWKIYFEEHRRMISNGGSVRDLIDRSIPVYPNGPEIQIGQSSPFNMVTTLPTDILTYTAIGRVVARYFVLHLYTDYGCCTSNAEAMLHLIVHSRTPIVVEKKSIPVPQNWSPQVFPKLQVQNMKPYMYSPLPQIPFLNMPGGQNIVMNNLTYSVQTNADLGYEISNDVILPKGPQNQYSYTPVYYNQDMFSDAERQQQGYFQQQQQQGYPPQFGGNSNQNNNIVRQLWKWYRIF